MKREKEQITKLLTNINKERSRDTVAVTETGEGIFVAANVKTRISEREGSSKLTFDINGYRIQKKHHDIIREIFQDSIKKIIVASPGHDVKSRTEHQGENKDYVKYRNSDNAKDHAEMQLLSYLRKQGIDTESAPLGISKPACECCDKHLRTMKKGNSGGESYPAEKVKNFRNPEYVKTTAETVTGKRKARWFSM